MSWTRLQEESGTHQASIAAEPMSVTLDGSFLVANTWEWSERLLDEAGSGLDDFSSQSSNLEASLMDALSQLNAERARSERLSLQVAVSRALARLPPIDPQTTERVCLAALTIQRYTRGHSSRQQSLDSMRLRQESAALRIQRWIHMWAAKSTLQRQRETQAAATILGAIHCYLAHTLCRQTKTQLKRALLRHRAAASGTSGDEQTDATRLSNSGLSACPSPSGFEAWHEREVHMLQSLHAMHCSQLMREHESSLESMRRALDDEQHASQESCARLELAVGKLRADNLCLQQRLATVLKAAATHVDMAAAREEEAFRQHQERQQTALSPDMDRHQLPHVSQFGQFQAASPRSPG